MIFRVIFSPKFQEFFCSPSKFKSSARNVKMTIMMIPRCRCTYKVQVKCTRTCTTKVSVRLARARGRCACAVVRLPRATPPLLAPAPWQGRPTSAFGRCPDSALLCLGLPKKLLKDKQQDHVMRKRTEKGGIGWREGVAFRDTYC